MGSLSRPWLSQFDKEYYHWEDNREQYNGITPDHGSARWKIDLKIGGSRLCESVDRLDEAQQAINTFRQSAGEN